MQMNQSQDLLGHDQDLGDQTQTKEDIVAPKETRANCLRMGAYGGFEKTRAGFQLHFKGELDNQSSPIAEDEFALLQVSGTVTWLLSLTPQSRVVVFASIRQTR